MNDTGPNRMPAWWEIQNTRGGIHFEDDLEADYGKALKHISALQDTIDRAKAAYYRGNWDQSANGMFNILSGVLTPSVLGLDPEEA